MRGTASERGRDVMCGRPSGLVLYVLFGDKVYVPTLGSFSPCCLFNTFERSWYAGGRAASPGKLTSVGWCVSFSLFPFLCRRLSLSFHFRSFTSAIYLGNCSPSRVMSTLCRTRRPTGDSRVGYTGSSSSSSLYFRCSSLVIVPIHVQRCRPPLL